MMQTESELSLSISDHLSVHTNRCLNSRGPADFCRNCQDACPDNAIEITDKGIQFNLECCSKCGLCAGHCPVGAITHSAFSPVDLIASANCKNQLDIYCQMGEGDFMPADSASIPCHGLLDERLLIGLSSVGLKQLNLHGLEHCHQCPAKGAVGQLSHTMKMTPEPLKKHFPSLPDLAESSGHPSNLKVGNGSATTPMDRRKFLDGAFNVVAFVALSSLTPASIRKSAKAVATPEQIAGSIKHVPASHQLALFSLRNGEVSAADSRWFHEVQAHGDCDGCGICALSCPTGALSIESAKRILQLGHRSGCCIGCKLCVELCPEQLLELHKVDSDATILDDLTRPLFKVETISCSSCGAGFTPTDQRINQHNALCHACENEHSIQGQWLDG